MTITAAYAECERITKAEARNFSYGIRLLPQAKRNALSAVYALARRIDDIGDGDLPVDAKLAALGQVRASLRAAPGDAVLEAVLDAAGRYPIELSAFDQLIDGVEMDVTGRTYATFDELVTYCECVAGSIGRLSLAIFGGDTGPRGREYANALGVALQQTNILRDVREDLTLGRVYLPAEDLVRFGVTLHLDEDGNLDSDSGSLDALIRDAAARANRWYDDGLRLLPLLDHRSRACCAAMAGIYRALLDRLAAEPRTSYDRRLSLSGWEKARVAARAMAGRAA